MPRYHDEILGSRRCVADMTSLGPELESRRCGIELLRVPPKVGW
jgi:hypothetical protein